MPWKEKAEAVIANDKEILRTGAGKTFEEFGTMIDGIERTYLSKKVPWRNSDNEIIGIMGISFDISDRKQLESDLYVAKLRAESALEHVIAVMPGHVYWEDKNSIILGCNDALAKAMALNSRHELIGKRLADYLQPDEAHRQRTTNQQVRDTNQPVTLETRFITKDNQVYFLLAQKIPLRDETGQVLGVLVTAIDITERKQMEQALQEAKEKAEAANLAKTDFIASMSHDFRTPLNGIIGLTEVLLMRIQQPEYRELLQNVLDCGKSIANLIENILNFAQIEAGRYELQIKAFDLGELCEHIVGMLTPQAQQKGIDLLLSYPFSLPCLVRSDALAINRIITNLISNAIKFTENGHVLVKVDCRKQSKSKAEFKITIEDTGIGIPEDKIQYIFERFTRTEPSYSSKYKGSGLGLAIVQKLLTSLSSTVKVTSTLGMGSCFTVTLPIKLQQNAEGDIKMPSKRLLIVDDHLLHNSLIYQNLNADFATVIHPTALLSELSKAEQQNNPYDVVIIDGQLNSSEKRELVKSIRHQFAEHYPLIVVTVASSSVEESSSYQECGADKVFTKPLRPSDLLNLAC